MNSYEGNLIVAEGIDKSGKTTVIEKLRRELNDEDWEFTHEPSNGKYGHILQDELKSDSEPTASDFFLFAADRFDHCNSLIGPKLDQGTNVLTDRYNLSTFAYQSKIIDEDLDVVDPFDYIDNVIGQFVIEPDLTILFDIPVEESLSRLDDDSEKYEKKETLKEAKRVYDYMASEKSYVETVDATQSEQEVFNDCLSLIESV